MIYETIVTTADRDGRPHIAPMGVRFEDGFAVLAPFRPSTTLDNVLATKSAVINFTTDVRLLGEANAAIEVADVVDFERRLEALCQDPALRVELGRGGLSQRGSRGLGRLAAYVGARLRVVGMGMSWGDLLSAR